MALAVHLGLGGVGQQQHVHRLGGAARGAKRIWRGPRRCLVALHPDDGQSGLGGSDHGPHGRPPRPDARAVGRRFGGVRWLCVGRPVGQHLGLWFGACAHGLCRQFVHLRAADGRYRFVVEPSARDSGGHLRQWQLHCRHHLAALGPAGCRDHRLAAHLYCTGYFLWRGHVFVGHAHATTPALGDTAACQ